MSDPQSKVSGEEVCPLGASINVATRPLHTKLNKLIISRLPLALPPQTSNPSTYVTGLLHVAPIYIAFESLWQDLLQHREARVDSQTSGRESESCELGTQLLDSDSYVLYPFNDSALLGHKSLGCDRVHSILNHLHLPGLLRSSALRSDIRTITGWPEHVVEEQLQATATSGQLQDFLAAIKTSVGQKPHVMLAYAWVFYMALFSGGKILQASLEAAGKSFWAQACDPVRPSMLACDADPSLPKGDELDTEADAPLPLAFFSFDTPLAGEDLKLEFKKRLAESEAILTADERDHVIQEAVGIFENTIRLVSQLDGLFVPPPTTSGFLSAWVGLLAPRVGGRLQDSVVVAKERSLRNNKSAADLEKQPRSLTTNSVSSMHVQGTLTPTAELSADYHGQDVQGKTVRFEKPLMTPARNDGRQGGKSCPAHLDGSVDEEPVSSGTPFGIAVSQFGWHHVALAGLVVVLIRGYFYTI